MKSGITVVVMGIALSFGSIAIAQETPERLAVRKLVEQVESDPAETTKALSELLRKKQTDPVVLEGIAAGFLQMGRYDLAKPALEQALGASKGKPSRDLVFNIAVLDIKQKQNAMRSVKMVADYMQRPDAAVDEPLQNVFGTLLMTAAQNKTSRKAPVFQQAVPVYMQHDAKLEEGRSDGSKRWGDQWMDADEKEELDETRAELLGKIKLATDEVTVASRQEDKARDNYGRLARAMSLSPRGSAQLEREAARAKSAWNEASKELAEAKQKRSDLWSEMPRPSWSEERSPIVPTVIATGQPTETVASAESTGDMAIPDPAPAGQTEVVTAEVPFPELKLPDAEPMTPEPVAVEPVAPEPTVVAAPPPPVRQPVRKPVTAAKTPKAPDKSTFGSSIFDFGEE